MITCRLSFLFLLSYSAVCQSSKLQGVINDDTGKTPAGVYIVAQSQTDHHTYSTLTGPAGDYVFASLPADTYTLCAQSPTSGHLNNCNWAAPVQVTLTASQTATKNISVSQGGIFQLRLDDPKKLIAASDDLLLGIYLPNGLFQPMRLASKDAAGRTYDTSAPLKGAVRLTIISSHLQIADDKGKDLTPPSNPNSTGAKPAASATVNLPGPQVINGPPVTFTVTGRK